MRTVAFNMSDDDDPGRTYVVARNRQVLTPAFEDAKEIFKRLQKIFKENPTYKEAHLSFDLLMRWKCAEDIARKLISEKN